METFGGRRTRPLCGQAVNRQTEQTMLKEILINQYFLKKRIRKRKIKVNMMSDLNEINKNRSKKDQNSHKNRLFYILAAVMALSATFPVSPLAATTLNSVTRLETNYSDDVQKGVIRYVNQSTRYGVQYFYDAYWGNNAYAAGWQCNLASISMALSYIGADKLPAEMQVESSVENAISGTGAVISNPDSVEEGIDRMEKGKCHYSPVVIWTSSYNTRYGSYMHWVIVAGRVSGNTYYIVDPAYGIYPGAFYTAQIEGNTLTAFQGISSAINGYYQFYA